GSSAAEYEDAAAVLPAGPPDHWVTGPVLAAVADGASESMLSGKWADHLVHAVLAAARQDPFALHSTDTVADAVLAAADQWPDWLAGYLARRERPLRWYEHAKLAQGAHATLLAARFDDAGWQAAAVGDSCLFQVRDAELVHAFPLRAAEQFGNQPDLVNSRG